MGTVHKLGTGCERVTLGQAVIAYLAGAGSAEDPGAHRLCGSTMRVLLALFGADADVIVLRGPAVAGCLAGPRGDRVLASRSGNREMLADLAGFCEAQGWIPAVAEIPATGGGLSGLAAGKGPAQTPGPLPGRDDLLRQDKTPRLLYEPAGVTGAVS